MQKYAGSEYALRKREWQQRNVSQSVEGAPPAAVLAKRRMMWQRVGQKQGARTWANSCLTGTETAREQASR